MKKLFLFTLALTFLISNAQIPFKGLQENHEGTAAWDADGTGPEPEAYGHTHPFGWGSSLYYAASRDYIDTHPDAALCHFLDNITGFPQFVQAMADNGFTAGQVKVKIDLMKFNDDVEGEDWFNFDDMHYLNRYDANYFIELNGESMITGYVDYFFSSDTLGGNSWYLKSNFTMPLDASENSSAEVREVATAFLSDMGGQELRFIFEDVRVATAFANTDGRLNGSYFEIVSGYLEQDLPELPFVGLASEHEGIAGWDADGTGPEPEAYGHTFDYGGLTWWMAYYIASRDYDNIDPSDQASLYHFIDGATGFPNFIIQLDYRGFSIDQLKVKSGISTLGNNIQGIDWDLEDSIHWYHHYGTNVTFEIDGEPILECFVDTNYSFDNVANVDEDWWSYSSYATVSNISDKARSDAQYVAASFLKDLGAHSIKSTMNGHYVDEDFGGNGRNGVFHQISNGAMVAGYADSLITHINKPLATFSETKPVTYPNPFNTSTTIEYELQQPERVTLRIYDFLGKQVLQSQENLPQGKQQLIWNAEEYSDGIYYYSLQVGDDVANGKLVKVR